MFRRFKDYLAEANVDLLAKKWGSGKDLSPQEWEEFTRLICYLKFGEW